MLVIDFAAWGHRSQNAIKAIRRKLRSDNPKVIMLTLTVSEALRACLNS